MRPSLLSLLCVRTASLFIVSCIASHFSYLYKATQILVCTYFTLVVLLTSLYSLFLAMKKLSSSDKTVGNSAMSTKNIIEPAYACFVC